MKFNNTKKNCILFHQYVILVYSSMSNSGTPNVLIWSALDSTQVQLIL